MMRFFPTLSEEYRSIRDAMRMRGITFGGGKVTKMIEYRLVPLLFSLYQYRGRVISGGSHQRSWSPGKKDECL